LSAWLRLRRSFPNTLSAGWKRPWWAVKNISPKNKGKGYFYGYAGRSKKLYFHCL
jgi:hypothetical protein